MIEELYSIYDNLGVERDRLAILIEKLKSKDINTTNIIKTNSGFEWLKVNGGFKDLTSGLVWKDNDEEGLYSFNEAIEKFMNKLPTKDEYEIALTHDLLEVVIFSRTWYWSASVNAGDRNYAWVFNGAFGNLFNHNRFNINSVRCVAR